MINSILKYIILNVAIFLGVALCLIIFFFLIGSGSSGFNKNWYYLILICGLIHAIICFVSLKLSIFKKCLISTIIIILYIYFYIE
jgi:hypothetical protein